MTDLVEPKEEQETVALCETEMDSEEDENTLAKSIVDDIIEETEN